MSCVGLRLTKRIAIHIIIYPLVVGAVEVDDGHGCLIHHGSSRVVILEAGLPAQAVVPLVVVHQRHLAHAVEACIVECSLLQFTCAHVAEGHHIVGGQVGCGAQFELSELLHAAVAHVDEGSTLGGIVIYVVAVAVLVHGSELASLAAVALGDECLVDLCAVLEGSGTDLEGAWVEVLVHAGAVEPVFGQAAVGIE